MADRTDAYLDKPLYRWPDRVMRLMLLSAGLLLTTWPLLVALVVLRPDISNVIWYALAALPVGPGLAAALYAARKLADRDDESTWTLFWKGYRLNWRDALKLWAVAVVVAAIVAVDLAWLRGQQSSWAPMLSTMLPLLALLVSPVVWLALVLASWFSFRTRDAARLAGFYYFTKPVVTVGILLVEAALIAVVLAVSDWAGHLAAGVACYAVAVVTQPVVEHAREFFVRDPETPAQ